MTAGRRRALRVGLVVATVIGLLLGGLWLLQRRLIYLPDTSPAPAAASVLVGGRDVELTTDDGLTLSAWYAAAPADGCRPTVLVAGGNAGNRADRRPLAAALVQSGFGVLVMDYRGYGGNPGSPSEDGLAADARAAYAFLAGSAGLPVSRLIYFGESLGSGVVTRLALTHPPAALLLRSPYTELADVAAELYPFLPVRLLLRDRFPVAQDVAKISVPLTVVYGADDELVPPALSVAVAGAAGGPSYLVRVDGAGHNDPALVHGPAVIGAVRQLATAIGCRPG